jgi:hypothetical protein
MERVLLLDGIHKGMIRGLSYPKETSTGRSYYTKIELDIQGMLGVVVCAGNKACVNMLYEAREYWIGKEITVINELRQGTEENDWYNSFSLAEDWSND